MNWTVRLLCILHVYVFNRFPQPIMAPNPLLGSQKNWRVSIKCLPMTIGLLAWESSEWEWSWGEIWVTSVRLEHFIMKISNEIRVPGRTYQYPPLITDHLYLSLYSTLVSLFIKLLTPKNKTRPEVWIAALGNHQTFAAGSAFHWFSLIDDLGTKAFKRALFFFRGFECHIIYMW